MKCAVLMATFNGAPFIEEQMLSIKNQIGCETDVFFSDDSSNDETLEIMARYATINLNKKKVKFGSAANNFLNMICDFSNANDYDVIFLSDQDDIWLPTKMIVASNELYQKSFDAYSGSYFNYYPDTNKICYINKKFLITNEASLFRSPGPGFTFAFKPSAFNAIRHELLKVRDQLSQFRWHDWPMFSIGINLGLKWKIDEQALTLYRQHKCNDTGQTDTLKQVVKRFRFLFSGEFRKQVLLLEIFDIENLCLKYISRLSLINRIKLVFKVKHMRTGLIERIILIFWILCCTSTAITTI